MKISGYVSPYTKYLNFSDGTQNVYTSITVEGYGGSSFLR